MMNLIRFIPYGTGWDLTLVHKLRKSNLAIGVVEILQIVSCEISKPSPATTVHTDRVALY